MRCCSPSLPVLSLAGLLLAVCYGWTVRLGATDARCADLGRGGTAAGGNQSQAQGIHAISGMGDDAFRATPYRLFLFHLALVVWALPLPPRRGLLICALLLGLVRPEGILPPWLRSP